MLVFIMPSRPIGQVVQNSKDGIAWWRIGDSFVPMPDEVRRRIYEEGGHDFSADICQGATLADLAKDAIANFPQCWFRRSGLKRLQTLSDKQLLMDCDAITDEGVTYTTEIEMIYTEETFCTPIDIAVMNKCNCKTSPCKHAKVQ